MKRFAAIAMLLGALHAPATADLRRGSQTLELGGGLTYWYGDWSVADHDVGRGPTIGARYLYYVTDSPSFSLGLDFLGSRVDDDATLFYPQRSNSRLEARLGELIVLSKLAYPRGPLRPYIFGGVGGYKSHLDIKVTPHAGASWSDTHTGETRQTYDSTITGLAIAYGVGLDWFLTENVFLGGEYREDYLVTGSHHPTGAGTRHWSDEGYPWETHRVMLRAGLKFGK